MTKKAILELLTSLEIDFMLDLSDRKMASSNNSADIKKSVDERKVPYFLHCEPVDFTV